MTICWQTPDPSVQFLVNMQTTDKFNADEQLRIGWPYDIIVLPLSVDQSKKMEANAFIKMAQFYNNLIMKRSKK